MPTEELAVPGGDIHTQQVGVPPCLCIRPEARDILHVDGKTALPKGPSHCAVEHLTLDRCTLPRLRSRKCVQFSRLFGAADCVARPLDRVSLAMESQTSPKLPARKAHLYSAKGHMSLVFHKHYCTLSPGLCEAEIPVEALAVVRMEISDDAGVYIWDQPKVTLPVA